MTQRIYIDRSRIITRERCPRRRFLEYHQDGMGIQPSRTPLAIAVGGAVHSGLAVLLQRSQMATLEDEAVTAALAEFSQHQAAIEIDTGELAAMQPTVAADVFQRQVITQAAELGMDAAAVAGLARDPAAARSEFDRYLFAEQSALVEALVRAYSRRRLQPLLSQFEVLEVEREGSWMLSCWDAGKETVHPSPLYQPDEYELWFMSRPDALLRERQTNELYLLSYKTTATWDVRKARDIEHDMQGLSEGVEVERRLGEWWQLLHAAKAQGQDVSNTTKLVHVFHAPEDRVVGTPWPTTESEDITPAVRNYLLALPAPPRIHAIRYEFLLKGYRSEDRELTSRLGVTAYTQHSHLVRQYVATSTPKKGDGGYRVGDVCWSWEFYRPEDDKDSKLAWQNWHARAVFESGYEEYGNSIKKWIDQLDDSTVLMSGEDSTVGLEPRALGYMSPAQAMGVTREHPLDEVFVPPVTVYRSDDQLRDWVEQVEHAERAVAGHVAEVNAATDPGERRHLLNLYFPQHRQSCEYPSQCTFARDRVGVCWAGAEMQANPLTVGGGEYVRRVANHPQELLSIAPVPK